MHARCAVVRPVATAVHRSAVAPTAICRNLRPRKTARTARVERGTAKQMKWIVVDNGRTIGQRGTEDGIILRDDEHPVGARITLERDGRIAPFAITCGIYGWLLHTRFFGSQQDAERDYLLMRAALESILHLALAGADENADGSMTQMADAIAAFVERYP